MAKRGQVARRADSGGRGDRAKGGNGDGDGSGATQLITGPKARTCRPKVSRAGAEVGGGRQGLGLTEGWRRRRPDAAQCGKAAKYKAV